MCPMRSRELSGKQGRGSIPSPGGKCSETEPPQQGRSTSNQRRAALCKHQHMRIMALFGILWSAVEHAAVAALVRLALLY